MASTATATIARSLVKLNWRTGATFNGKELDPQGIDVSSNDRAIDLLDGIGLGQFNRVGVKDGTLTSVTPGTTDTLLFDLTTMLDPAGAASVLAEGVLVAVMNHATTAGYTLEVGAAASNPYTGFLGGTTPKIILPPGHLDPIDGIARPAVFLIASGCLAGVGAVSGASKILKLYTAAASLAYSVIVLGRSA
jgi:hypothetical protein